MIIFNFRKINTVSIYIILNIKKLDQELFTIYLSINKNLER